MGTIGNRVYLKEYRGFESLPVRQKTLSPAKILAGEIFHHDQAASTSFAIGNDRVTASA